MERVCMLFFVKYSELLGYHVINDQEKRQWKTNSLERSSLS